MAAAGGVQGHSMQFESDRAKNCRSFNYTFLHLHQPEDTFHASMHTEYIPVAAIFTGNMTTCDVMLQWLPRCRRCNMWIRNILIDTTKERQE